MKLKISKQFHAGEHKEGKPKRNWSLLSFCNRIIQHIWIFSIWATSQLVPSRRSSIMRRILIE